MRHNGMCKEIFEWIGDGEKTYREICEAFPQYEKEKIGGALSSMCRRKTLGKKGTVKVRIYLHHGKQVEFAKKSDSIVRPFKGNVFADPLGKVPHILDPRRDHKEREQLAMMVR